MTDHDIDILARTLYGEGRGEFGRNGPASLIAIANVVLNRFKKGGRYGRTIAEICLKPRQFSCWNAKDPNRCLLHQKNLDIDPLFKLCLRVSQKVLRGTWPDLTRESDHYHAVTCKPSWARVKKIKLRIGNHIFYKLS